MNKYTLTYERTKSQEIYIENIGNGNNESLYFNQEYKDARKLIKEIVDSQGTKNDKPEKRKEKRNKIKKYGCNNRILFTGQRGCGKTSVMRSLADYLSSEDIEINSERYPKDNDGVPYVVKFSCLPMVDPSHFDNNNNILLTVITSMFSEAKKKMYDDKDGGDTSYREELLKQFEKVFKSLDSIKSELSSYTLESLNRKSDAEDLKDKMKDLVNKYLRFKGCGDGDEARLLLLIDDIDMSVSYASEMLEQLRKYLELDNLVILMSANLGQLSNEMREKYSSSFQYTLKDSNQALSIDVEDLATKYLLKLFPTSRRINVERQVGQLLETDLIIKEAGKEDITGEFQKVILSQIWSKTRLLFIPKDSENTLHPIIPTNLRDLAQFLDMLTSLDVVEPGDDNLFDNDGKSYINCRNNLQTFKNYVIKTWIPNHLKVEEELVFHNIPSDITEINKHLINSINVIGTKHKEDLMSRQVGLDIIEKNADNVFIDRDIYTMVSPNDPKFVKANKISDIFNQPSNYSYGDLLLMIDKYETYFESEEHRSFTDAIKIYYSILLFETMFFKSNNVVYDIYGEVARSFSIEEKKEIKSNYIGTNVEDLVQLKKLVQNVCEKDSQVDKDMMIINKRNELMSRKIPIQKLIGGNVYYPNYFEIITDKNFNQKGPSFDAKRAFYHKVKVGKNEKVGDTYPLFSVLYYGDIRPDRYEKDHIYDTTFNKNADVDGENYVTFDILSILNNMLNPFHTLSRLDNDIFRPEKKKWDKTVNDIQNWGDHNIIGNMSFPNAILPFYSVDIMLHYLSQSYQAGEVITTDEAPQSASVLSFHNQYKNEKELIEKGKMMFQLTSRNAYFAFLGFLIPLIKEECINILQKSTLDGEKKVMKIERIKNESYEEARMNKQDTSDIREWSGYNKRIDSIKDYYDFIHKDIKENKIFTECKQCIEEYIKKHNSADNKSKSILKQNLEILKNSYVRYREIITSTEYNSFPEITQEFYLDCVISSMMEYYQGSKKDRDVLIKELHKFTTISEIYKHLVEVLWNNAIMETLIRADIQKGIRSQKSVGRYYGLLWKETEKILAQITVGDTNPKDIYQKLCEEARNIFIYNEFSLKINRDDLS